jgi:hypothetical protein
MKNSSSPSSSSLTSSSSGYMGGSVDDARPADGFIIEVFASFERLGVAFFGITCDSVDFVLLGEVPGRKGFGTGSGDVSAADDKAIDRIMVLVDLGNAGFGEDFGLVLPLLTDITSSSSSDVSKSKTAEFDPALFPTRKGRSVVGTVA